MKYLLDYLHIKKLGLLEVLFALYPILGAYKYGVPFNIIVIIIMDVFALITRKKHRIENKLLVWLFAFILIHELIVFLISGLTSSHFNSIISTVILLVSFFILAPRFNYGKMVGALNIVAIISCIGIFYHLMMLFSGHLITPIHLPFLPEPDLSSRLFEEGLRPCSFFMEPASFVTFCMIPLFVAVYEKKYLLMSFYLVSIFLSTSTNGIVMAPIMILSSLFMQKKIGLPVFISIFILGGLFYFFVNSYLFEGGLEKIENTEMESNSRLSNGPWLVSQMPIEHIVLGIPVHTPQEYFRLMSISTERIDSKDNFYMSDFWRVLVIYGVVGLTLHILSLLLFIRMETKLIPYLIVLLIAQFTQSIAFSSTYVFQFCFIMAFIYSHAPSFSYKRGNR